MLRMAFSTVTLLALLHSTPSFAQEKKKLDFPKTPKGWINWLETKEEVKYRRVAIIFLEGYGPREPGVVNALLKALQTDKSDKIRRQAAQTLGRMDEQELKGATEALGDRLQRDKSSEVREAAALA